MVAEPRFVHLSPDDHARVTAAVTAAEMHTDGEIVTIVSDNSSSYSDWALKWSLLPPLLLATCVSLCPRWFEARLHRLTGDWNPSFTPGEYLGLLVASMILLLLLMRWLMQWRVLRMALVPSITKARRVRRAAIRSFRIGAEARTVGRTGVLIYVSIAERRSEIVADQAIHQRVAPETWGDAMAHLVNHIRRGDAGEGMVQAVAQVGDILRAHFPRSSTDTNELPDRLIEL